MLHQGFFSNSPPWPPWGADRQFNMASTPDQPAMQFGLVFSNFYDHRASEVSEYKW